MDLYAATILLRVTEKVIVANSIISYKILSVVDMIKSKNSLCFEIDQMTIGKQTLEKAMIWRFIGSLAVSSKLSGYFLALLMSGWLRDPGMHVLLIIELIFRLVIISVVCKFIKEVKLVATRGHFTV